MAATIFHARIFRYWKFR